MTIVGRWTGREAKLLREALRLSVRDFAARLGVGMRTVNKWEARQADITQRPHMQAVLDTALSRASDEAKARFSASAHVDVPEHETARLSRGVMLPVVVNGRLVFVPFDVDTVGNSGLSALLDKMATSGAVGDLERLASAARQPTRVDVTVVEYLELVTQTQRALYHYLSSAELVAAVTGHLQTTTLLLGGAQQLPLRRRLGAIAGETAGHAAWLFHDLGDRRSAARYYSLAEIATQQAGDLALDAYVRGFRSLVRGSEGQAQEALAFARGAVEMAELSATATMRAWLAGVEAQAWASVGDPTACCGALRRAEIDMGKARREDDPPWMYEFDHTRLLALAGGCYAQVGKVAAAEQTLREALEELGPQRRRRRAEVLIDLAGVRAQQQDIDEAAGLARQSLEIAVETGSVAGVQRVRRFRSDLARWDGAPAVIALDEQLDDAG